MIGSNLHLTRPLAILDLESTGVDPARDRIVEIAVVKLFPEGTRKCFQERVKPPMPIPPCAITVHGITDQDVATSSRFDALAESLGRFRDGTDLAGFGLYNFDLPLLCTEFVRAGRPFRIAGRKVIDVLTIYRRYEPRDLTRAVQYYLNREHREAHSAVSDAEATAEILSRQVLLYDLPDTSEELHTTFVEVDVACRFRRDALRRIVFAFGKHTGQQLRDVARHDRGYLRWMLDQAFLDDVTTLVQRALTGQLRDDE